MTERIMNGPVNPEGPLPPKPETQPRPAPPAFSDTDAHRTMMPPGGPQRSTELPFSHREPPTLEELAAQASATLGGELHAPLRKPTEENVNEFQNALSSLQDPGKSPAEIFEATKGVMSPGMMLLGLQGEQREKMEQFLKGRGLLQEKPEEALHAEVDPAPIEGIKTLDQLKEGGSSILAELQNTMDGIDTNSFNPTMPMDEADQEKIRGIISKGKTHLADLLQHPFFHSKGVEITKKSFMGLLMTALYIALALFALEMQLLIAIGKGGGGK